MMLYNLLFLFSIVLVVDAVAVRNADMPKAEKEKSMTLFILQQISQLASKLDKVKDANQEQKLAINNIENDMKKSEKIENMENKLENLRKTVTKGDNQLVSEIDNIKTRVTAIEAKVKFHHKSCESNWLLHDGHCYFYGNSLKTWSDAENDCMQRKSHLVNVDTASENEWIYKIMKANNGVYMWMGASDTEKEGSFQWVSDGSKVVYNNWDGGQPDNANNAEDCLMMWKQGSWNDSGCLSKFNYFCEKN